MLKTVIKLRLFIKILNSDLLFYFLVFEFGDNQWLLSIVVPEEIGFEEVGPVEVPKLEASEENFYLIIFHKFDIYFCSKTTTRKFNFNSSFSKKHIKIYHIGPNH